jgi:hypothetical protein
VITRGNRRLTIDIYVIAGLPWDGSLPVELSWNV